MENQITSWMELSVEVDHEAVESVSDLLAQYGYNGGVAIDQPIIPGADGPEYTYDLDRPVTLRTYVPMDERAEEVRSRVEQALWHFGQMRPVGPLRMATVNEEDWANAWKKHYTIQHVGQRTVIVPSWLEYDAQPDEVILRLDPGMAFGTGLHPTTQLCLVLLEQYVQPAMKIIDLGCGSGILSVAAAQLEAAAVLALDTDPIAVDATRNNLELNAMDDRVQVAEGSLGKGASFGHWMGWNTGRTSASADQESLDKGPNASQAEWQHCDLIVANIIARVLVAVADDIAATLAPGGLVISSGIITEREAEVMAAYTAAGFECLDRQQQGDWVAFVHRKAA
ncbi:MAG: methyltransferase domain-containing protein [Chloroflexi bacterium AL-W]|nr:methyltransferase domain-containing protein [Chloroflexi bacterium AL-N1]NOK65046.1 methyltransferase domain-containing protein [Chloroflexi bacterium AL-N10]NOK72687.1 methyltransferase domain-containing protein [Chloroflexi bacterium AL-N5]NOK79225.1 methyltransferase domain-containing protein [Chloroflexi bacterium AL-W]NOK87141.1 methyltransferase domain-containing protein [Chloroflexi bacterium AL-N15]